MAAEPASLATFVDLLAGPPKTVTVYGPRAYGDLESLLRRFDVDLVHESLPVPESAGYLTVTEGERFLGSVPAAAFDELVDPPRESPWDESARESAFRDLTALLTGTEFWTDDRRHLLATSREFEDRAWRVGRGSLHAGFQSLAVMRSQLGVYERLAGESDLSVTVYGDPDWEPPADLEFTVKSDPGGELGRYWFLAFDGGGADDMACALVAEERQPGSFYGAWTYDPDLVANLVTHLERSY